LCVQFVVAPMIALFVLSPWIDYVMTENGVSIFPAR
jgi:hypothetical protein